MPSTNEKIAGHYDVGGLYDRVIAALDENGVARNEITAEHLAYIDEFHIGGAAATRALLDPLNIPKGSSALDVGSGLGGPARFLAREFGLKVTGIDLTPDFVDFAKKASADLGVDVEFVIGSALEMPFDTDQFDVATLLHVGMNLPDKGKLLSEVARVLKPGGHFAVYDVMLFGAHPMFPLPWASEPDASFLQAPEDYLDAAEAAGFDLINRRDRGDVAKTFFSDMQARMERDGPPIIGPPLLMGQTAGQKVANMVAAVRAGDIAPVEMIFRNATREATYG